MKLNALLDVNVVAHETTDEVAVLLDLEAPPAPELDAPRPPSTLEVVLDRSGSMSGAPLEGAKKALIGLVQRLDPKDNFGVVVFDDTAEVAVPAGPLGDKDRVIAQIESIYARGMTDLSAGYVRALRELKRVSASSTTRGTSTTGSSATLLVISDGHVNGGITDLDEFASIAAKAYADGTVTSTLGYGEGYDESMLSALARSGNGNHVFAAEPDAAGAAIAAEVDGLLEKVVQGASLTINFEPTVEFLRLFNDLPANQLGNGQVMVELGDFYGGEARKLLMKFRVPAMAGLGVAQIATLELQYVELPGLVEHTVFVPISVNVVPGDEAANRIPDPTVRSEVLFQEAQDLKRQASEAFERGDGEAATHLLSLTDGVLGEALSVAPPAASMSIEAERKDVTRMRAMRDRDAHYMSKLTRESYHRQNRKRGRVEREPE